MTTLLKDGETVHVLTQRAVGAAGETSASYLVASRSKALDYICKGLDEALRIEIREATEEHAHLPYVESHDLPVDLTPCQQSKPEATKVDLAALNVYTVTYEHHREGVSSSTHATEESAIDAMASFISDNIHRGEDGINTHKMSNQEIVDFYNENVNDFAACGCTVDWDVSTLEFPRFILETALTAST